MSSPSDTADSRSVRFIALEGVDGSGKTTQADRLAAWCRAQGYDVVLTREPGGTTLGERLRGLILDPAIPCAARTELMLILAARAQHVAEVIVPALRAGRLVITDRFTLSSLAYQGYGRGLPLEEVRAADAVATAGIRPDLTLLVDVSLENIRARIGARHDRFEGEGGTFLERIIDGYRQLAAADPTLCRIDGAMPIDVVQESIRQAVGSRLPAPTLREEN